MNGVSQIPSQSHTKAAAAIFTLVGFVTLPSILNLPAAGIDQSWIIGLNMAMERGLQFGKDIVFTFGPLGFMWSPTLCYPDLWITAAIVTAVVHIIFVFLIVLMAVRHGATMRDYVLLSVVLLLSLYEVSLDCRLTLCAVILLYLAMTSRFKSKFSLTAALLSAAVFTAAASLVKFTQAIVGVWMLCVAAGVFIRRKQAYGWVTLLIAYPASALFLWILCGQRIGNIPAYIRNSYEIAAGYNVAMQLHENGMYVLLAAVTAGFWVILLWAAARAKEANLGLLLLIGLGFVGMNYKYAAVRSDIIHIRDFTAGGLIVYSLMLLPLREAGNRLARMRAAAYICTAMLALAAATANYKTIVSGLSRNLSPSHWAGVKSCIADMTGSIAQVKSTIRNKHGLSESTIASIGRRRVDVFTFEISLAYAYDLNWSPRPVFQSYSAYTRRLDMLNERHLRGLDAPEVILYDPSVCIDDRNPIADEPATFRAIMTLYKMTGSEGEFTIFEKKEIVPAMEERPVFAVDAKMGRPVEVPKKSNQLYARIKTEYTPAGQLIKLLYKPAAMQMKIISGGEARSFRFVNSTAENGVFLLPMNSFIIYTDRPGQYKQHIRVEFFEMAPQKGEGAS